MAKKTEVEITITEQGQVKMHVQGLAGPGCLKETAQLETTLGRTVKRDLTTEYYQAAPGLGQAVDQKKPGT